MTQLKMNYTKEMKMTKVRLCGPDNSVDEIQGFISDGAKTVPLNPIGNNNLNCDDFEIKENSWISKITISYNTNKVNYIKLQTQNQDVLVERG